MHECLSANKKDSRWLFPWAWSCLPGCTCWSISWQLFQSFPLCVKLVGKFAKQRRSVSGQAQSKAKRGRPSKPYLVDTCSVISRSTLTSFEPPASKKADSDMGRRLLLLVIPLCPEPGLNVSGIPRASLLSIVRGVSNALLILRTSTVP